MLKVISVYFHTLKYLKFTQVYYRALKQFSRPKVHLVIGKRSAILGHWMIQELYPQKFLNEMEVEFLNHKGEVNSLSDWNNDQEERLWLYNLHYFDDLNSFGSQSRKELQKYWINNSTRIYIVDIWLVCVLKLGPQVLERKF